MCRIEFRGIRAARVYPETLPNLPQGTQQIILGRYLPEGHDQTGEVIVSGTLAGKPVQLCGPRVRSRTPNPGNSFIPRLWARMYLDTLLEQGAAAAIRDEIIALSEEYHIITPYTSLLVLESDADRERFAVKPRFQMRDGEKFFAEGRDNANWELVQQQMKRAGTWRQGLRRDVLRQLATLGRNPRAFQVSRELNNFSFFVGFLRGGDGGDESLTADSGWKSGGMGGMGGGMMGGMGGEIDGVNRLGLLPFSAASGPEDATSDTTRDLGEAGADYRGQPLPELDEPAARAEAASGPATAPAPVELEKSVSAQSWDMPGEVSSEGEANGEEMSDRRDAGEKVVQEDSLSLSTDKDVSDGWAEADAYRQGRISVNALADLDVAGELSGSNSVGLSLPARGGSVSLNEQLTYANWSWRQQSTAWVNTLFPTLPSPPTEPKQPKQPWPAEARQLARSLLRIDALAGLKDGLRIEIESKGFDARWNELQSRAETLVLVSPAAWLDRSQSDNWQTIVTWCDAKQRGALSAAYLLGRVRASKPADLQHPPLGRGSGTSVPLDLTNADCIVQVKSPEKGRKLLVLTERDDPKSEDRFLIDTVRSVILTVETHYDGKLTSTLTQSDFVQLGGVWWAGRIETTERRGPPNFAGDAEVHRPGPRRDGPPVETRVDPPRAGATAPRAAAEAGRRAEGAGRRSCGI